MRKELKKQIKQDDFVTGLDLASHWIREHSREIQIALVAAVGLGAAALGVSYVREGQRSEAEKAFEEALTTFHAPLESEVPVGAPRPTGPVFKTVAEKYQKAAAAFDGVGRRFSSQDSGRRARYYAALCRVEMGDLAGAEKDLKALSSAQEAASPMDAALARLALAEAYRGLGKPDQAIELYRQMADDPALMTPKDHVLIRLASLLEEQRKFSEARASYRRLMDAYPSSSYAAEAGRRVEYLKTAS